MTQLKRSLALILAIAVLGGLFVTGISAIGKDPHAVATGDLHIADYTDVDATDEQLAIYGLTALGVLQGNGNGTFSPDANIKRAEFAVYVYYLMGYTKNDLAYFAAKTSAFADVAEGNIYEGYINACAQDGLFIGDENGFRPDANMTMAEVVTVLLRCIGYDDNLPGNWPNNYVNKAINIGLIPRVGFYANNAATRNEVSKYAFASLGYNVVDYVPNGTVASLGFLQGSVDSDGYAYLLFRTNEEGNVVQGPKMLLEYALGATSDSINFAASNPTTVLTEAAAWEISDTAKGQISIVDNNGEEYTLASKYYIFGGSLVTLGDNTEGTIIKKGNDVVFVLAGKEPNATAAATYATATNELDFAVVDAIDSNFIYFDADTDLADVFANDILTINAALSSYSKHVFYNMTTKAFINAADINVNDVIYKAGKLNSANATDTDLYLVYNPVDASFTEYDDYDANGAKFCVVNGTKYFALDNHSFATFDGGKTFDDFENLTEGTLYENMITGDTTIDEFGDVSFVASYNGKNVAIIGKNFPEAATAFGIVTGFELASKGLVFDATGWHEIFTISGIKVIDINGETTTYGVTHNDGSADYIFTEANGGTEAVALGDLVEIAANPASSTANKHAITTIYTYDAIDNADEYNKVTGIGNYIGVQFETTCQNDDFSDMYEVFSTNENTKAFYVTVKGTAVTVEIFDQAKVAASNEYNQFEPYTFFNNDETGLEYAYISGTKAAAASTTVGTYATGIATNVTKMADDTWAIIIDGVRYATAKNFAFAALDNSTTVDADFAQLNKNTFVLYALSEGKISHLILVAQTGASEYTANEDRYELADTQAIEIGLKGGINAGAFTNTVTTTNATYKIMETGIEEIFLTAGDFRIQVDNANIDPNTLFIDNASIIDLSTGKTGTVIDLMNRVAADDTFIVIYNLNTNAVAYIIYN